MSEFAALAKQIRAAGPEQRVGVGQVVSASDTVVTVRLNGADVPVPVAGSLAAGLTAGDMVVVLWNGMNPIVMGRAGGPSGGGYELASDPAFQWFTAITNARMVFRHGTVVDYTIPTYTVTDPSGMAWTLPQLTFVGANTTAGAVTITLPDLNVLGGRGESVAITIADIAGNASTNNISVVAAGTQHLINGSADPIVIADAFASRQFTAVYMTATAWIA